MLYRRPYVEDLHDREMMASWWTRVNSGGRTRMWMLLGLVAIIVVVYYMTNRHRTPATEEVRQVKITDKQSAKHYRVHKENSLDTPASLRFPHKGFKQPKDNLQQHSSNKQLPPKWPILQQRPNIAHDVISDAVGNKAQLKQETAQKPKDDLSQKVDSPPHELKQENILKQEEIVVPGAVGRTKQLNNEAAKESENGLPKDKASPSTQLNKDDTKSIPKQKDIPATQNQPKDTTTRQNTTKMYGPYKNMTKEAFLRNISEFISSKSVKPKPINFKTKLENMDKWVHLDLKGAPPSLDYLKDLIPLLKSWGATGVLLEYEDMFPYERELQVLRAKGCYTRREIQIILKTIELLEMEAIPLVQTLGHLEYVLKHPGFASLREHPKYPDFLNPAHRNSTKFLFNMIDQVMALHKKLRYLHIGADEVGVMGESDTSKKFMTANGLETPHELYLHHIKKLAKYVRDKYPGVKVLIWDDMIRHMDLDTLQKSDIGSLVLPMVWNYAPDISAYISHDTWKKYSLVFDSAYVASAFKGASGSNQHIPNLNIHIANHLSWLDTMEWIYKENVHINIKGICLTGWSRYDHFSALCDLLPTSIPSLALCLQIVNQGGFDVSLFDKVTQSLHCEDQTVGKPELFAIDTAQHGKYGYNDNAPICSFPGSELYYAVLDYHKILKKFEKYFDPISGKAMGHCNRFSLGHEFIDPYRVDRLCSLAATELLQAFGSFETEMRILFHKTYTYEVDISAEWLEEHVTHFQMWLKDYDVRVKNAASGSRVWGTRPDRHVDKLTDKNAQAVVAGAT